METFQNEDFASDRRRASPCRSAWLSHEANRIRKSLRFPSDLRATLRHDLKGVEYYEDCTDTFPDQPHPWVVVWPLDLGHGMFLYVRLGRGWRQILAEGGVGLWVCGRAGAPPCPLPKGSHSSRGVYGWPDLEVSIHGSAYDATQLVYRFNGEVYKAVACRELKDQKPRPCLPIYKAPELVIERGRAVQPSRYAPWRHG